MTQVDVHGWSDKARERGWNENAIAEMQGRMQSADAAGDSLTYIKAFVAKSKASHVTPTDLATEVGMTPEDIDAGLQELTQQF